MRTCCCILILLALYAAPGGAQTVVLPDSIEHRFAGVPKDSNYVVRLNALATQYLGQSPVTTRAIAAYTADLASRIKFTKGYARALTISGNTFWHEGIYEFAQNYYLLAARQYRTIGDSVGLGQVYNNIGEVNKRLGNLDRARDYLEQSIRLKRNDSTLGISLYNIGDVYLKQRQLKQATAYMNEAVALGRQTNDTRTIAFAYWGLARIKNAQRLYDEALGYLRMAEELWQTVGEKRSNVQTYLLLSETYRLAHQPDKALQYLDKAVAVTRTMRAPDLRLSIYLQQYKIDSTRGEYRQAVASMAKYNVLKDSVYNLLKAEQIARVQSIYENESREREYQQLRVEKTLRDEELRSKEGVLTVISIGLFILGILAWILFRQRRQILKVNKKLQDRNTEIHDQKEAIEIQAAALLKLNEELQELNRTLEQRIEKRSTQLLVQNQKLTEYTFINAHKLRAPVASILGLINLIHQVTPEEREEIIALMKNCGEQLDAIIREISRNLEGAIIKEKA